MVAIYEAYTSIPNLLLARDAFIAMILKCPPTIRLKTLQRSQTKELEYIIETYWLKWCTDIYDYLQVFGIAPWYWKKLKDSKHHIPVVPPMLSGYFTTFLTSRHDQQFNFYYNDNEKRASNMYFEIKGHPPSMNGKFTSPVSTLLNEYKTSKILRQACEISWHQQARLQHIIEHHPAKNVPGDDNLMNLETFGENIAGFVVQQQEAIHAKKMQVRKQDMYNAIAMSSYKNKSLQQKYGTHKYTHNEKDREEWERNNASLLEKSITLNSDFSYKAVPSPQVHADYVKVMQRLDQLSSAIMDIPLNWIENTGSMTTRANAQGNVRFVNEKIQDWINYFERLLKKAFLINYGETIQQELTYMFADEEVEVYMQCTPLASANDIRQIYMDGMISKKNAATHIFNTLGLPNSEIEISEPVILPTTTTKKAALNPV
jgi:hypothetical protein